MIPTSTSHILRKFLKDIGSNIRVDADGFPIGELSFPDVQGSAQDFARRYQAYNIARKRTIGTFGRQQLKTALGKWEESEYRCRVVNQYGGWVFPINAADRHCLSSLKKRTTMHISRILSGHWPVLELNATSGATATTVKSMSFAFSKLDGTPLELENPEPHKCVPASEDYLAYLLELDPATANRLYRARYKLYHVEPDANGSYIGDQDMTEVCNDLANWLCTNVPPSVIMPVPKNVDEARLIVKPNTYSVMVQKTIGDAIRQALLEEGVNLNDQTVNQEWAEIGSYTNLIATYDLSAASDSIALHHLSYFPKQWQEYFLATREGLVVADLKSSNPYTLQKIAGMGNGFIFELESLLFYAMTLAVVEELNLNTKFVSVYGDDIIAPRGTADMLEMFFLSEGFLLNREKSYHDGPFRESCGKHFYNGFDVTPFYVRGDAINVCDFYHIYNGLSDWSCRTGISIREVLKYVLSHIKPSERYWVPRHWSTRSGLYDPDISLVPKRRWSKHLQRYQYTYTRYLASEISVRERLPPWVQVTGWLHAACNREPLEGVDFAFKQLSRRTRRFIAGDSLYKAVVFDCGWKSRERKTKHGDVNLREDA